MKKGILIFLGLTAAVAGTILLVKKFKKPATAPATPTNFSDENFSDENLSDENFSDENFSDEFDNATGKRLKKIQGRVMENKYARQAISAGTRVVNRTPAKHITGFAKKRFGR
jgi:hypothetical protein